MSGGDGSTGGKGKRTGRREIGGEGTGKDVEERSLEREEREGNGWVGYGMRRQGNGSGNSKYSIEIEKEKRMNRRKWKGRD